MPRFALPGMTARTLKGDLMDNVTKFPTPTEKPIEFLIGPFEEWRVKVDGRSIPKLTGSRDADGKVWLTVDHRITAYFSSDEDAYQAAVLAANAMAIGAGYSHAGAENKDKPFAPLMTCIGSVTTE